MEQKNESGEVQPYNSHTGGKRRRRRGNIFFRIVLTFLLLCLIVGGAGAYYVYDQLQPVASNGQVIEKKVTIPAGSSIREIGQLLESEGLIKNSGLFPYYMRYDGRSGKLQAGDYQFTPGQSLEQLIDKMVQGDVVIETVKFTVPEGLNVSQIADSLAKQGLVNKDTFLHEINDGDFSQFSFVSEIPQKAERTYRLEGYLFPETYEVKKGASEHEIIAKMLSQFEKELNKIDEDWQTKLKQQQLSLDDAVNLAAIVEREVVVDQERPVVAGVFFNRMRDKWMLQSCATVQFVLGKQRDRITFDDLKVESPYNTYTNYGLPPGPIASPGRASLGAVIQPEHHDYFFFVTKKDGSSEHYFSRTLQEHMARDAKSRGNW